jgi:type III pantothenate kinase
MHLLIDVGNTRIKWLLVDGNYDASIQAHYGCIDDFACYIKSLPVAKIDVVLAAVNQTDVLNKLLKRTGFNKVEVVSTQREQLGVVNSYENPERMGVDRWLAMVAAYNNVFTPQTSKNEGTNGVIVVDAGSALTVDVVEHTGQHLGGYIVPGLMMAQQVLFANTERVIKYDESNIELSVGTEFNNLGKNTLQCVEYGVINQLVALVQMVVNRYPNFEILCTGGDGELIANFFTTAVVDRNLVLKGLWQVRK